MKQLKDLLYGVQIEATQGQTDVEIKQISFDSRAIKSGDLFVAIQGDSVDGHNYIDKAITNGAIVVIGEQKPKHFPEDIVWVATKNSRAALAILASNFYDQPSKALKLVGVTEPMEKLLPPLCYKVCFKKRDLRLGYFLP